MVDLSYWVLKKKKKRKGGIGMKESVDCEKNSLCMWKERERDYTVDVIIFNSVLGQLVIV